MFNRTFKPFGRIFIPKISHIPSQTFQSYPDVQSLQKRFITDTNVLKYLQQRSRTTLWNISHRPSQTFQSYPDVHSLQKRFITDADVLKSLQQTRTTLLDRTSRTDPRISKVLKLIRSRDYALAEKMVKEKNISIDSHDRWENTPLTDAAMRGDENAVKFLIDKMGANPHASCDCPHHKTALHYASENGHDRVVQVLLDRGADVNVLDSRRYTALDVASTKQIKRIIVSKGGKFGRQVPNDGRQKLNLPKADCPSLTRIGTKAD